MRLSEELRTRRLEDLAAQALELERQLSQLRHQVACLDTARQDLTDRLASERQAHVVIRKSLQDQIHRWREVAINHFNQVCLLAPPRVLVLTAQGTLEVQSFSDALSKVQTR